MSFNKDNASIHSSASTKAFFRENEINVMEWPACSPDLNPIENLWGILVRDVYAHNKQYGNVNELKVAIQQAWNNVKVETLENLVKSVPNRLIEVINVKGASTHY